MLRILFYVLLLSVFINVDAQNVPTFATRHIPEMEYMVELNKWEKCKSTFLKSEDLAKIRKNWEKIVPLIKKNHISADAVKKMSRWAKKQMKKYKKISDISKLKFFPIRKYKKNNEVLLKAIVDVLPTHSPLVTRWFIIYILADIKTAAIKGVIFTIRGELLE